MSNILKFFLVAVLATILQGCAVVGAGIGAAIGDAIEEVGRSMDKNGGIVEVGEVKTKPNASQTLLKTARVSSAVFEKDMVTPIASPAPDDAKVNAIVTDEIMQLLGANGNVASSVSVIVKTMFNNEGMATGYYYKDITNKYKDSSLTFWQKGAVRKVINTYLTLEQDGNTLLEARGHWAGSKLGDEIAGARQLAREMASEVLKKLSATTSTPPTVTEAKKE